MSIRRDEVKDLAARMVRMVCCHVSTKTLILDGEHMRQRAANTINKARLDNSDRWFRMRGQKPFMDIGIFDPMVGSHNDLSLEAAQ
ncbi:hypothetical protein E2C01_100263 [Portunus trituberculatus]|uniref:Uncharacterized protein n=1 Tax=Portunus trituberculatus TaxID=210409 RepID=A0A5B7KHI5_PORTR|nr:hypothetical protein [Portunus trituberculatus]